MKHDNGKAASRAARNRRLAEGTPLQLQALARQTAGGGDDNPSPQDEAMLQLIEQGFTPEQAAAIVTDSIGRKDSIGTIAGRAA